MVQPGKAVAGPSYNGHDGKNNRGIFLEKVKYEREELYR